MAIQKFELDAATDLDKQKLPIKTVNGVSPNSSGDVVVNDYVTKLSVSGKTITYTKKDGSTGTITTQDTGANGLQKGDIITVGDVTSFTMPATGLVVCCLTRGDWTERYAYVNGVQVAHIWSGNHNHSEHHVSVTFFANAGDAITSNDTMYCTRVIPINVA